jgi:hypothetical protein
MAPKEKVTLTRVGADGKVATLATGKADEHGQFSGLNFTVPDSWPDGVETVTAKGASSGRTASATFVVEASTPGAEPSVYFGKPMSPVNFSGAGFHPGEKVDVYFDSLAASPLGDIVADESGTVHVKGIAVPPASPGDHAFLLVGRSSGAPVRVPFSVLAFTPWLALSDYTPQPEKTVNVVANDFAPGEHVAIFLGKAVGQPVTEAIADAKGVARATPAFVVPYQLRGKLVVVAVGNVSQIPVTATLTVRPYTPLFGLSTYAGPPGSLVGVSGQGYGHEEKVTITLGAPGSNPAPSAITIVTDQNGAFKVAGAVRIPDKTSGKIQVTAVGEHSQVPASVAFAVLPLAPWINAVPAAGPAGAEVAIAGGGFEPAEPVDFGVRGAPAGANSTVIANDKGELKNAGTIAIPRGTKGPITLLATGRKSGVQATATYTIISA